VCLKLFARRVFVLKKYIALCIAVIVVLSLGGCTTKNGGNVSSAPSSKPTSSSVPSTASEIASDIGEGVSNVASGTGSMVSGTVSSVESAMK